MSSLGRELAKWRKCGRMFKLRFVNYYSSGLKGDNTPQQICNPTNFKEKLGK